MLRFQNKKKNGKITKWVENPKNFTRYLYLICVLHNFDKYLLKDFFFFCDPN